MKISLLLLAGGLLSAGCARQTQQPTLSNKAAAQALVNSMTGNAHGSRDTARALRAQSQQLLAAKNYKGAMEKRLQMLSVRGKDPSTFGALTFYAIQQLALSDIATIASHLDAPACRKYAAQLKATDTQMPTYPAMLERQKANEIKTFTRYSSDPQKWATAIKGIGLSAREQTELENTSPAQIKANIGSAFDALIQKAKGTYSSAKVVINADPYTRNFAMPFSPSMGQLLWTKNKLERQFVIASLQQRAARLEKKPLAEPLPADPFGTGPLKNKNGVVYSVGPDTVDDGGKPIPRPQYPRPTDKGDIPAPVF